MAQLKNYPLIEQITILPGNNLHFQKKKGGKTFPSLNKYMKPYHTTHLQKKREKNDKILSIK